MNFLHSSKISEKEYFDYLISRSKLRMFLRKMIFLLPIAKEVKGKVLDVGCGIGEFLEIYPHAIGVDANQCNVKYCKKRGLNVKQASVYDLKFKSEIFDWVVLINLLEHLSKPQKTIKEIRRVLKKGGKVFITLPSKAGFKRDKTHVKFWDKKDICNFLEENGFKVERIFTYPFRLFHNFFWFNELRVIAKKYE